MHIVLPVLQFISQEQNFIDICRHIGAMTLQVIKIGKFCLK